MYEHNIFIESHLYFYEVCTCNYTLFNTILTGSIDIFAV